jgi:hypothetical protein
MLAQQLNSTRFARIAFFAVLLTLWLSFAFIDHQFDSISEHHTHHDCQQFSCILLGLSSHVPNIPPVIEHGFITPRANTIKVQRPTSAYLARSPPIV